MDRLTYNTPVGVMPSIYTEDFTLDMDDTTYEGYRKIINKLAHYEDLEEAGRLVKLPCAVCDTVYGIRRYHGVRKVQSGIVSEMYFSQKNRLIIVIKYVCRGYWGENIFGSHEEAEAAQKERESE